MECASRARACMMLVLWGGLDMWRGLCEGQAVVACAKSLGSRACARLDTLVEKERRCERDAGAAGERRARRQMVGRARGGAACRHEAGHDDSAALGPSLT